MRKIAKNGPKKERTKKYDGIRVASSRRGEALPQEACVWDCVVLRLTRWGEGPPRIVYATRIPPRLIEDQGFKLNE